MPYHGRPSAGCETCRKRKIKCDRVQPVCGYCVRSGWGCGGYRDLVDLIFHDESAKVMAKARITSDRHNVKRVPAKRQKKEQASSNVGRVAYSRSNNTREILKAEVDNPKEQYLSLAPEGILALDLDQLASGYFLTYYLVDTQADASDTRRALEDSPCLSASLIALGAARVTNSGPGPACSPQARARYLRAISLTNEALQSAIDVKKDSTLLAVKLLGIFEMTSGCESTLESWYDHIQGAAALLELRGIQQFETAEGGRLFMQTASSLITSCFCRRVAVPAHIHTLMALAATCIPDPSDQAWRHFVLISRFADLYAKLLPNNAPQSSNEAGAIFEEALSLDRDMLELLDDASQDSLNGWSFRTAQADGPTVFAGYVRWYRELFTVQHYNTITMRRIMLQDIILKALLSRQQLNWRPPQPSELQYLGSISATVHQLQHDVLASVPQHLGAAFSDLNLTYDATGESLAATPRDNMWSNFAMKDRNPWQTKRRQAPALPFVRGDCGFTLQWPLYVTGAADALDGPMRLWVIKQLRYIGQKMGLQQALLLATSLELGRGEQLNAHLLFEN